MEKSYQSVQVVNKSIYSDIVIDLVAARVDEATDELNTSDSVAIGHLDSSESHANSVLGARLAIEAQAEGTALFGVIGALAEAGGANSIEAELALLIAETSLLVEAISADWCGADFASVGVLLAGDSNVAHIPGARVEQAALAAVEAIVLHLAGAVLQALVKEARVATLAVLVAETGLHAHAVRAGVWDGACAALVGLLPAGVFTAVLAFDELVSVHPVLQLC